MGFLSSAVVLWRFSFTPTTSVDEESERVLLAKRETRARVAVAFLMILLGMFVIVAAAVDLAHDNETLPYIEVMIYGPVTVLFSVPFTFLALFKFRFASVLKSESLRKDGVCSIIGASLGFLFLVETSTYGRVVWFDPLVSFFVGLLAVCLGVRAVSRAATVENHAVFDKEWWLSSDEEDTEEDSDEPKSGSNTNVELPPLEEVNLGDGGALNSPYP